MRFTAPADARLSQEVAYASTVFHPSSRLGEIVPAQSDIEHLPSIDPAERLRRWAALVAVGEASLPEDLKPVELKVVLAEVARLRRERLVRLIARAIAQDLHGDRESE